MKDDFLAFFILTVVGMIIFCFVMDNFFWHPKNPDVYDDVKCVHGFSYIRIDSYMWVVEYDTHSEIVRCEEKDGN